MTQQQDKLLTHISAPSLSCWVSSPDVVIQNFFWSNAADIVNFTPTAFLPTLDCWPHTTTDPGHEPVRKRRREDQVDEAAWREGYQRGEGKWKRGLNKWQTARKRCWIKCKCLPSLGWWRKTKSRGSELFAAGGRGANHKSGRKGE